MTRGVLHHMKNDTPIVINKIPPKKQHKIPKLPEHFFSLKTLPKV